MPRRHVAGAPRLSPSPRGAAPPRRELASRSSGKSLAPQLPARSRRRDREGGSRGCARPGRCRGPPGVPALLLLPLLVPLLGRRAATGAGGRGASSPSGCGCGCGCLTARSDRGEPAGGQRRRQHQPWSCASPTALSFPSPPTLRVRHRQLPGSRAEGKSACLRGSRLLLARENWARRGTGTRLGQGHAGLLHTSCLFPPAPVILPHELLCCLQTLPCGLSPFYPGRRGPLTS